MLFLGIETKEFRVLGTNTMCIIQCIDCVCCDLLTLVPLKSNYFNGRVYWHFQSWDRMDLVHRFRNAGKINMQVYGEMCMNQECPKRQPNYTPREGEKINRNCGSVHCYNSTWHLVKCRGKNYSFDHHPRSRQPFFKFYFFFLVDDFLQFNEREREREGREREIKLVLLYFNIFFVWLHL